MSFYYLNRVGSRIVRPERSECKIGPSTFSSSCTSRKAFLACDILCVVRCIIANLGPLRDVRELLTLCVREAIV